MRGCGQRRHAERRQATRLPPFVSLSRGCGRVKPPSRRSGRSAPAHQQNQDHDDEDDDEGSAADIHLDAPSNDASRGAGRSRKAHAACQAVRSGLEEDRHASIVECGAKRQAAERFDVGFQLERCGSASRSRRETFAWLCWSGWATARRLNPRPRLSSLNVSASSIARLPQRPPPLPEPDRASPAERLSARPGSGAAHAMQWTTPCASAPASALRRPPAR